jgi:SagB-type dehydrogenase family enzyme
MYGLEVYLVAGMVTGLDAGIYKYRPKTNELELVRQGDFRYELADAALAQLFVEKAPVTIIIAAVYERLENKYTDKGVPYAHIEAGHAGQNIYLQAVALNLGTCAVASFVPPDIKKLVNMPDNEEPIYLFPVGEPEK